MMSFGVVGSRAYDGDALKILLYRKLARGMSLIGSTADESIYESSLSYSLSVVARVAHLHCQLASRDFC